MRFFCDHKGLELGDVQMVSRRHIEGVLGPSSLPDERVEVLRLPIRFFILYR